MTLLRRGQQDQSDLEARLSSTKELIQHGARNQPFFQPVTSFKKNL